MFHQPVGERLVTHLRDHYGIDAVAATKASQHHDHVFRVDRRDGDPWIARGSRRPPAGRREGDAAILRFLERHDYPAERLATKTRCRRSTTRPSSSPDSSPAGRSPWPGHEGSEKFAIMGDLLGRLHAAVRRVRQPPRWGERG